MGWRAEGGREAKIIANNKCDKDLNCSIKVSNQAAGVSRKGTFQWESKRTAELSKASVNSVVVNVVPFENFHLSELYYLPLQ